MTFRDPCDCPEIIKSANFAYSPITLVATLVFLPTVIILQWLFGWDNQTAFQAACLGWAIALPFVVIASAWHAFDYIPKKWRENVCQKRKQESLRSGEGGRR